MEEVSAYHESGHVLMAALCGARVVSVTIEPDYDDGPRRYGDTKIEWPVSRLTRKELLEKIVQVTLAGPVAEMIHTGDPFHPGFVPEWASDWNTAWESAKELMPDERKRLAWLERVSVNLHQTLSRDDLWAALAAIVDHLLAHESLESDEVEQILSVWL